MNCPNCAGFRLHNVYTHETIIINCNTYKCPVCGPKKLFKLRKAISNKISSWNRIRLMTFTMTSRLHESPEEHYKALVEVWRYFITYLRRTKALSNKQRNVNYIKCPDLHKSGYLHFHAFFSEYIPRDVMNNIWEHSCKHILHTDTHAGNVHAEGIYHARAAANYVTKYITKAIDKAPFLLVRYSKSKDVVLFEKRKKQEGWMILLPDKSISSLYQDANVFFNLSSLETYHKIIELNSAIFDTGAQIQFNYNSS